MRSVFVLLNEYRRTFNDLVADLVFQSVVSRRELLHFPLLLF